MREKENKKVNELEIERCAGQNSFCVEVYSLSDVQSVPEHFSLQMTWSDTDIVMATEHSLLGLSGVRLSVSKGSRKPSNLDFKPPLTLFFLVIGFIYSLCFANRHRPREDVVS